MAETPAEWAARTRKAQGLPVKATGAVLDLIASYLPRPRVDKKRPRRK